MIYSHAIQKADELVYEVQVRPEVASGILERSAVKVASCVLMGERGRKASALPDKLIIVGLMELLKVRTPKPKIKTFVRVHADKKNDYRRKPKHPGRREG